MTDRSTELHRLGFLVGLVAAYGSQEKERHAAEGETSQYPAIPGPAKIDGENWRGSIAIAFPPLPPVEQIAGNNQGQPEEEKAWRYYIRQDTHVRVAVVREIEREQQKVSEKAAQGDDQPGQANPITKQERRP